MDAERLGWLGPPLGPLGGGHLGPRGLAGLLRSAGGRVEAERLGVVCADAQAWWAEQWAHGERRPLERMGRRALAAYRAAAFAAIEACREADGVALAGGGDLRRCQQLRTPTARNRDR